MSEVFHKTHVKRMEKQAQLTEESEIFLPLLDLDAVFILDQPSADVLSNQDRLVAEASDTRLALERVRDSIQHMNTSQTDGREAHDPYIKHLVARLPHLRTVEDLEALEKQGYSMRSSLGIFNRKSVEPQRVRLEFVNRGLIEEARQFVGSSDGDFSPDRLEASCVESVRLALDLLLAPPDGIDVCGRNPKQELPQLARLLMRSHLYNQPVPFVVPCCPDTNQYRLSTGLGTVVPKGLDYCFAVRETFAKYGFRTRFELQIADVEALDPIILANSGETTESHFAKTAQTISKAEDEVVRRGQENCIVVRSMQAAFAETDMEYGVTQRVAIERITQKASSTENVRLRKTIDGLLAERVRLGNFDHFDDVTRRELVVAELAGYAAYGKMVHGRAIILSPDAASAIPAYHYAVETPVQYSPVLYAK